MYNIQANSKFRKKYQKLIKNNKQLEGKIRKVFGTLQNNPFDSLLRSHKVNTVDGVVAWSSRVTGDIRIIWKLVDSQVRIIQLLDIGGHSGGNKVYR